MSDQKQKNSQTGRVVGLVVGLILLVIGLGLLWFGGKTLYDNYMLSTEGIPTTGTVVSYETYTDSDQDTRYQAIINFQVGGTVYRHKDPSATLSPTYDINQPVDLLYRPDAPEFVVINRTVDLWLNPLLPLGGGIFVTLIGLAFALRKD